MHVKSPAQGLPHRSADPVAAALSLFIYCMLFIACLSPIKMLALQGVHQCSPRAQNSAWHVLRAQ